MPRADIPLGMEIAAPAAPSGVAAPTSSFELPKAVGAWAWSVQEAIQPPVATPDDVRRRHLVVGPDGDLHGFSNLRIKAAQGRECQSKRAPWRRFTCLGSCEFPGGVNSPPRVLPSTNNGLVSTRGARRALLPHLIAHSGAGFAFSQKEDFRRSMSSWLARAADLLARVAMNRLRLACCSRASELAIYGGLTHDAYCGRRRRVYLRALFLAYRRGYFFG